MGVFPEIDHQPYQLHRKIACSCDDVFSISTSYGTERVLKILRKSSTGTANPCEVIISSRFQHPFLSRAEGFACVDDCLGIVMPHYGISASTLLKRGLLEHDTAVRYIVHIVKAVSFLHDNNYLHLDIKTDNVLISEADGIARLSDFGCARRSINGECRSLQLLGTPAFRPVEIYRCKDDLKDARYLYTTGCDVWSLGHFITAIITGKTIFRDDVDLSSDRSIYNYLKTVFVKTRIRVGTFAHIFKNCPFRDDITRLMIGTFSYDPRSRIRLLDILNCRIFSEIVARDHPPSRANIPNGHEMNDDLRNHLAIWRSEEPTSVHTFETLFTSGQQAIIRSQLAEEVEDLMKILSRQMDISNIGAPLFAVCYWIAYKFLIGPDDQIRNSIMQKYHIKDIALKRAEISALIAIGNNMNEVNSSGGSIGIIIEHTRQI